MMFNFLQFLVEGRHNDYEYASPSPDSTSVHLHLADKDQEVHTPWGAKLQAKAGKHYIVSNSDDTNDKWVIHKGIGDTVYHKNDNGTYQKRPDLVYPVRTAKRSHTIHTLEGPVKAAKGDRIMVGTMGERWPIKPEQFAKKYSMLSDRTGLHQKLTKDQRKHVIGVRKK